MEESKQYVRKLSNWIDRADFVVFEVSIEEVSLGFEMKMALERSKPILVLYDCRKGQLPFTLKGVTLNRLIIYDYDQRDDQELKEILKSALGDIRDQLETRFTMILPSDINSYLNKVADNRSEYIRKLIRQDMKRKKK